MSVAVKFNGSTIVSLSETATKTLKTSGKYCKGDITIENTEQSFATVYTGSGEPSSSTGTDGDIYLDLGVS